MKFAALVSLVVSALWVGCGGDRPDDGGDIGGELNGGVYVGTSPVSGVSVRAFRVDEDGRQEDLATSEPTGADGQFTIAIPGTFQIGEIELEARGAGATYLEAASGAQATFGSQTRLRSPLVRWDSSQVNLDYDYVDGDKRSDLVINVWTELAVDYAEKLLRANRASSFAQARDDALRVFHDVLEHDYWTVRPVSLVDGPVGAFADAELAGAMGTGFSHLARRIAVASSLSPGSISSLELLATLSLDLGDDATILDGKAATGGDALTIGACRQADVFCTVSSHFLRADWAESLALFLASEQNHSGVRFGDVEALLERMARRTGPLWIEAGVSPDRSPPTISITGLQDGAMLIGESVSFTVTVEDAFSLDITDPIELQRGAQSWAEGTDSQLTVTRDETDKTKHTLQVTLDSTAFIDGAIELVVVAKDKAKPANNSELRWTLFSENSPAGTVSGTVNLGGRVNNALVTAYDVTGGPSAMLGSPLGSGMTDSAGHYQFELAESPNTTEVLIVVSNPASGTASFVDIASGATILLSAGQSFEAVISGYTDGDNITAHVTPWTHLAAAFARALWMSPTWYSSDPQQWDEAIIDGHNQFRNHFDDLGPLIDLLATRAADLSDGAETTTLNAQVRYGLIIAGLSEVAKAHAVASQATSASMNTLTLTERLADDIGALNGSIEPIFNGRFAGGPLKHGDVDLDSYTTRVELAQAVVRFIETNPVDATTLVEADIFALLERISLDANQRLYPQTDPPIAYDTEPPGPLSFTAPTPTNNAVLRGSISLRATASDNRKLTGFVWTAPAGISSAQLDTTAGFTGPWVLTGNLDLEALSDGAVTITATATDEALNTSPVSTTIIVDKTNPSISIGVANDGSGAIAGGGWTGSATLASVSGTATDTNAITVEYRWNNGSWATVTLSGSAWSITNLPLANGANTLDVRATDPAGNVGTQSATYNRDATPPTVGQVASANSATVQNEGIYGVSITGGGAGTVVYNTNAAEDVQVQDGFSFTKWAGRYTGAGPNLPEWRWDITDNRTSAGAITAEYRVLRGGTPLTAWAALPVSVGVGYNRALTVSAAIHAEIGQVSGTYSIEVRATDEFGNASGVSAVSWSQTVKSPALRVAADGIFTCGDADVLNTYSLGDPRCTGGGSNNYAFVLNGVVPAFRVGVWRVDNPNPIPARVRVGSSAASVYYNRGYMHSFPETTSTWSVTPPPVTPTLPNGDTYTKPFPTFQVTFPIHVTETVALSGFQFRDGANSVLSACSGCASNEREVPANTSVYVFAQTGPLSWLDPTHASQYTNNAMYLDLPPTAGVVQEEFQNCETFEGQPLMCTSTTIRQTVRHLTRVQTNFSATATLESRAGTGTWSTAPGGTADNAAAKGAAHTTAETGYPIW